MERESEGVVYKSSPPALILRIAVLVANIVDSVKLKILLIELLFFWLIYAQNNGIVILFEAQKEHHASQLLVAACW